MPETTGHRADGAPGLDSHGSVVGANIVLRSVVLLRSRAVLCR